MNVTIVIPCFNEEENIYPLYRRLKNTMDDLGRDYEIIFVNDASTDKTLTFITEIKAKDPNIKACVLNQHRGKEIALVEGFKKAQGEIIATIDSDLQNYPEDIPLLLDKLKEYDAVIGWRKDRNDNFLKIISSRIANSTRRIVLGENLHDAGCGLRAFKRDCLKGLECYNLFDVFLMSLFRIRGYKVSEVVVRDAKRKLGKSKFNIRNRLFKNGWGLIVVWINSTQNRRGEFNGNA